MQKKGKNLRKIQVVIPTDINLIQYLAGHKNPKTTMIDKHLSTRYISKIQTPLDQML